MKVTFKLNAAQAVRAECAVAEATARYLVEMEKPVDDRMDVMAYGNALTLWSHRCFNHNQWLEFNQANNTLTYEGERHPLKQDGGLDIIEKIANGDLFDLKVIEYQTSDNRLHWHETLYSYMFSRSDPAEFFEYSKKEFGKYPDFLMNQGYLPQFVVRCHELLEQHGLLQCLRDIKRGKPEAQLRASWKPDELKLVRTIEGYMP